MEIILQDKEEQGQWLSLLRYLVTSHNSSEWISHEEEISKLCAPISDIFSSQDARGDGGSGGEQDYIMFVEQSTWIFCPLVAFDMPVGRTEG